MVKLIGYISRFVTSILFYKITYYYNRHAQNCTIELCGYLCDCRHFELLEAVHLLFPQIIISTPLLERPSSHLNHYHHELFHTTPLYSASCATFKIYIKSRAEVHFWAFPCFAFSRRRVLIIRIIRSFVRAQFFA